MSDLPEAIGSLAEGALTARAVEPATGAADGHTEEVTCLNCKTPLVGPHCHRCGQKAHVHRTISAFLHDLVHAVLHVEGKIWHTLPLLAWRPGELTRRYIDGERARFVSPMALFLFSVFLMFAVFQAAGVGAPTEFGNVNIPTPGSPVQLERQLAGLKEARAELADDNPAVPVIDAQIESVEERLAAAEDPATAEPDDSVLAASADGSVKLTQARSGLPFIDRGIDKWEENPGLMAYKLQANSYKFSWLLIPLSIPFVWLLFAWRRKFRAYDHAVFVTYSLSFMTLFFITLTLLGVIGLGGGWLFALTVTVPVWHIYRQLKGAYGLSRFSALWRTSVLLGFILLILVLFLDALLVLGALG